MGKRRERQRKRAQQELQNAASTTSSDTVIEGSTPFPFSLSEVAVCIKVINAVTDDEKLLQHSQLREFRKALDPLVKKRLETYVPLENQSVRPPPRKKQKISDTDRINSTKLRSERMKHLEKLNEEGKEEVLRVLDGVGLDHTPNTLLLTNSSDQLQLPAGETVSISDVLPHEVETPKHVDNPIKCYICKEKFTKLHFYYDQLCPNCADLNYRKRTETVDMKGKVCIVTGARVKIGYRCVLKLLRCGATVIGTTRFPADAARRFEREDDFNMWSCNLHLYGLDFRNIGALEAFCEFIKQQYARLDVIINNACQTIRRPPAYYTHLLENEKNASPTTGSGLLLKGNFEFTRKLANAMNSPRTKSITPAVDVTMDDLEQGADIEEIHDDSHGEHIEKVPRIQPSTNKPQQMQHVTSVPLVPVSSAEMTQMELVPEDSNYSTALFPTQTTDVNEQQVDLRTKNSWMLKLDEVSTPELAEVMVINAMAPTIINSKLKTLMEQDPETPKFIVNVSAMEGKFYRYKSETHPHTNMAKAALNMMTRTSAQDYKKNNIYMTSVDTGWINDEKPLNIAVQHMKTHNFQTPLDEIDAAARVLDPVIAPLLDLAQGRTFDPPWGIFLKDYSKCEW